jgi:hypothetical protein
MEIYSTDSRKNFTSIESFITEPDSRAQSIALEENVKEFGLTYFGMTDRRQGKRDSLAPITTRLLSSRSRYRTYHRSRTGLYGMQPLRPRLVSAYIFISSRALLAFVVTPTPQVSLTPC